MIATGAMNRRVRIEKSVETRSPTTNAIVKSWVLVAEAWAHRLDVSAREFVSAGSINNAEQVAVFTTKYRTGITPAMRLISQGQTFNITGVTEVGLKAQLQIQGKAVNSTATS